MVPTWLMLRSSLGTTWLFCGLLSDMLSCNWCENELDQDTVVKSSSNVSCSGKRNQTCQSKNNQKVK